MGKAGKELELFHPTPTKIEIERNAKSFIEINSLAGVRYSSTSK